MAYLAFQSRTAAGHRSGARVRQSKRRRGVAMVIAMLFMVLFAVMSLGFYASVSTGVKVTGNERYRTDSFLAAESGIHFLLYQIKQVGITRTADKTVWFDSIASALSTKLTGTGNMVDADDLTTRNPTRLPTSSGSFYTPSAVAPLADGTRVLATYFIPGHTMSGVVPVPHFLRLGNGMGQATIVMRCVSRPNAVAPTDITKNDIAITLSVVGRTGNGANPIYRALQYDLLDKTSTGGTSIPNGSIITYSAVNASNGVTIAADVLAYPSTSQVPATITGGARLSGQLQYPAGYPAPVVNNGGSISSVSTVSGIPPPPTFDVSPFAALAAPANGTVHGSSWQSGKTFNSVVFDSSSQVGSTNTYNNIRIKANSNPTFQNSTTFNGVIYIESPNKVTFGGGSVINGVIVSDNSTNVPYNSSSQNNTITIANGVTLRGTGSISTTGLPAAEVTRMNTLKGMFVDSSGTQINSSMILAPNFGMSFQGGMTVPNAAAIVGAAFNIANGSNLSLSGVLINLGVGNTAFTLGGGMNITKTGTPVSWPGVGGAATTTFTYQRSTYNEVKPWDFVAQP